MKFPIVPTKPIPLLAGMANGKLPDDLLVDIGPGGRLVTPAARSWTAMARACKASTGIDLTWTWGGTYRTYEDQHRLFMSRYVTTRQPGEPTKTFEGRTWWRKPGVATAATPGSSNHGWGRAVDVAVDLQPADGVSPDDATELSPVLPWLLANADMYRWSWELQSEPWHLRFYGDGTEPMPDDAPSPRPQVKPLSVEVKLVALRQGMTHRDVVLLKALLQHKFGQQVDLSDRNRENFGPELTKAVRNAQGICRSHGHPDLAVDGIVGARSWPILLEYGGTA